MEGFCLAPYSNESIKICYCYFRKRYQHYILDRTLIKDYGTFYKDFGDIIFNKCFDKLVIGNESMKMHFCYFLIGIKIVCYRCLRRFSIPTICAFTRKFTVYKLVKTVYSDSIKLLQIIK